MFQGEQITRNSRDTHMCDCLQDLIEHLIHKQFGLENTYNIGFTTYTGTVTAADSWNMDADFKRIRPSRNESIEFLPHDALMNNNQYFLLFRSNNPSIQLSKELNDEFNEQR
jgi:erythromycin esterase-like protein